MKRKSLFIFALFFSALFVVAYQTVITASTTSTTSSKRTEEVFRTQGVVWSFTFISEQEVLATLRDGKLLYANLASGSVRELPLPLSVVVAGQGGLMEVYYQPHNGEAYVYLTYVTEYRDELTTALARGRWDGNEVSGLETIFIAKAMGDGGRHFGSRLEFIDNHIYMTMGDRAERDLAQSLSYHNGKILRLTMDGAPAAGNPFSDTADALAEIWSYGHRNPQGIDWDEVGERLYSIEFGPRGGDELNLIQPGKNYGWPLISHGREYWGPSFDTHLAGMEQPLVFWTPSISPSGMAFYDGNKIPEWKGNLFVAALGSRHLLRLVLKAGEVVLQEPLFTDLDERVRHVRTGMDGYLYFSTDSGKIMKVTP